MTPEQRAVLAHVVVDPDGWYAHAVETLGQRQADDALAAKVARWETEYQAAASQPGYKSRAQRD